MCRPAKCEEVFRSTYLRRFVADLLHVVLAKVPLLLVVGQHEGLHGHQLRHCHERRRRVRPAATLVPSCGAPFGAQAIGHAVSTRVWGLPDLGGDRRDVLAHERKPGCDAHLPDRECFVWMSSLSLFSRQNRPRRCVRRFWTDRHPGRWMPKVPSPQRCGTSRSCDARSVCVCVRARVRACVCMCVRACVRCDDSLLTGRDCRVRRKFRWRRQTRYSNEHTRTISSTKVSTGGSHPRATRMQPCGVTVGQAWIQGRPVRRGCTGRSRQRVRPRTKRGSNRSKLTRSA